jgi:hypothetical protein
VQELQTLGDNVGVEQPDAGGVAAGSIEACDKPVLDGIAGAQKDNRNGTGSRLGCPGRIDAVGVNHRNFSVNQIGDHGRETILVTFAPADFKCDVVTFDIARFLQPLPECGNARGSTLLRSVVEKSDHRPL